MESQGTIVALTSLFFAAKIKAGVEAAGHRYRGAMGAAGLRSAIADEAPLAIFLDLAKEDVDFEALVAELRGDPATQSVPIVAFTGHVNAEDLASANQWGCIAVTNGALSADFAGVLARALATA